MVGNGRWKLSLIRRGQEDGNNAKKIETLCGSASKRIHGYSPPVRSPLFRYAVEGFPVFFGLSSALWAICRFHPNSFVGPFCQPTNL